MTATAERQITAFLDGEDSPDISNPIHSTAVAAEYGFRGPLVGGVTTYGWMAPAIIEALGERWLDDGWADVSFRRPIYPGDEVTARAEPSGDGRWEVSMTNQDGERCIAGFAGLGQAPWLAELASPTRRDPEPKPENVPYLTMEVAPVGQDLRPMGITLSHEDAVTYALEKQRDGSERWTEAGARIHPGWIASKMTPMLHHSYDYAPAIHTRSQIQHLAPAVTGQALVFAGHFSDTFERKGHHYAVIDGVMLGEDGRELARLRHTTIYRVAK
jgi:hypothetical protein